MSTAKKSEKLGNRRPSNTRSSDSSSDSSVNLSDSEDATISQFLQRVNEATEELRLVYSSNSDEAKMLGERNLQMRAALQEIADSTEVIARELLKKPANKEVIRMSPNQVAQMVSNVHYKLANKLTSETSNSTEEGMKLATIPRQISGDSDTSANSQTSAGWNVEKEVDPKDLDYPIHLEMVCKPKMPKVTNPPKFTTTPKPKKKP